MDPQIKQLLAFLQLLLLLYLPTANAAITSCSKADRNALLGFTSGLKTENGKSLPSWNKTVDCCHWNGITCNSLGNVVALNMAFSSSRLKVVFTVNLNPVTKYLPRLQSLQLLNLSTIRLSQSFPVALTQLPQLRFLYLRSSNIWSSLPPELGNFTKLEALDLGRNEDLEGNLDVLCSLKNLNYISMSFTSVSGVIPRCLADLSKLAYLDLSFQALNGKIPEQLGKLSNLIHLDLSGNNFGQRIPAQLCNLTKLQYLNLGGNQHLTGSVSACFGGLSNLIELSLDRCSLNGEIPSSLSKLSKLQRLDLGGGNSFVGSVPSWLGELSDLQYLRLSGTLGGVIPESLGNLAKLREITFESLNLTGGFPRSFTNLYNLEILQITGSKNLAGSLPDLGRLTKLKTLSIASTGMSGNIPDSIGRCSQLESVGLSYNSFSGGIPKGLGNLAKLTNIGLGNNKLTGNIPSELGKLQNLTSLNMPSNQLSGQIPAEIGDLRSLDGLDLSKNSLTGSIPASFARLSSLSSMILSDNKLSGPLPDMVSAPPNLYTLFLQNNQLTGKIPAWIVNASKAIQSINLSNNQFVSEIAMIPPSSFLDLHGNKLQGTVRFNFTVDWSVDQGFVFTIDLSENEFTSVEYTGDRPDAGADAFSPLQYLSLAGNKIKGKIPGFIGIRMDEFQTLDLSRNQFYGEIPASFVNLTQLTSFNVSNNHLSGQIPQGGVLNSFPVSTFANNDGLCGTPLPACK